MEERASDYLEKILTAQVYDVAIESPLELAPLLSRRLNNRLLLKCEDMQAVFSFVAALIPERPGSFRAFCQLLGARNITECNYRYADPKDAVVFVGLEISNRQECAALMTSLQAHGLRALDLTDNEIAKLHIRHMVGGHAPHVTNERLYALHFPNAQVHCSAS